MATKILIGDCIEQMKTLPDRSVHCCVTSPPYWGLRDYGTAQWEGGDPKCTHAPTDEEIKRAVMRSSGLGVARGTQEESARSRMMPKDVCPKCGARRSDVQIGLEKTPEEYVVKLVSVFREVKRVLRDDGTLWLNLGDSYSNSSSGRSGNDKSRVGDGGGDPGVLRKGVGKHNGIRIPHTVENLPAKNLVGIPWRVAFALQADGWILRQDIIWSKPSPMPESVTDRCTKAHEYIFLLTKSQKYYYDARAIAEPTTSELTYQDKSKQGYNNSFIGGHFSPGVRLWGKEDRMKNKRSVWTVASQPYADAHFATFPPKLIEPCILAGTSKKGCCPTCGTPWARVTEEEEVARRKPEGGIRAKEKETLGQAGTHGLREGVRTMSIKTVGWKQSCNCPPHEPAHSTILGPFGGSGTTGKVANELMNRDTILIELNPKYWDMAKKRTKRQGLLW